MNTKARFWLPSLADIFFVCPFLILSLNSGNNLLNDGDTGYHIRAGEYIISHLKVPQYDIFSYISPPLPWFAHEWLSEVIMAFVHRLSGLTGIVIFFSFLIGVTYFLLFKFCRSLNCNLVLTAPLVLLATVSSSLHWLARPHIFSLLLTIVWYSILSHYQSQGKGRLYLLPILMLLWVNLHGGFIIGFVLLGVYIAGNAVTLLFSTEAERSTAKANCKTLAVVTVLCLLFALFNPRGYATLIFPFRMISNQFLMQNVLEFLSPNFHDPLPYKYLLLLMIAILAVSRAPFRPIEVILVLLLTYMSLYSGRYIPLFAIIVTPVLLQRMEILLGAVDNPAIRFFRTRSKNLESIDATARSHLWPVITMLGVCILALKGQIEFNFDENKKPVAAVKFLREEKIPGYMFNDDEFGDYVIYAAWPQYRVFFDGRSDMYGEAWGRQYLNVVTIRRDWEDVIEKNNFTWIFSGTGSPLSNILLEKKNWHLVYADKVAQIFVKRIAENKFLVDRYPDVKPVETKKTNGSRE